MDQLTCFVRLAPFSLFSNKLASRPCNQQGSIARSSLDGLGNRRSHSGLSHPFFRLSFSYFPSFLFLIYSILFSFIHSFRDYLKSNFIKSVVPRVLLGNGRFWEKLKVKIRNCSLIFCLPCYFDNRCLYNA